MNKSIIGAYPSLSTLLADTALEAALYRQKATGNTLTAEEYKARLSNLGRMQQAYIENIRKQLELFPELP